MRVFQETALKLPCVRGRDKGIGRTDGNRCRQTNHFLKPAALFLLRGFAFFCTLSLVLPQVSFRSFHPGNALPCKPFSKQTASARLRCLFGRRSAALFRMKAHPAARQKTAVATAAGHAGSETKKYFVPPPTDNDSTQRLKCNETLKKKHKKEQKTSFRNRKCRPKTPDPANRKSCLQGRAFLWKF